MMPMALYIRWRRNGGYRFGIWIPLILLWLLILPFALILLPLAIVLIALAGGRPFKTLAALWAMAAATRGTRIALEKERSEFLIRIV
jgi:hypothetical protein